MCKSPDLCYDSIRPMKPAATHVLTLLAGLGVMAYGLSPDQQTAEPTPEQREFFETKIRPVLANNCYSCHGKDVQMAGLRVDSLAAMKKGGDSGPAIQPGD